MLFRSPIILGGESDHTLARIVEFCDGWLPRTRQALNPGDAVARLKKAADAKGRDFRTLSITVFGAPTDQNALDGYAKAGITGALLAIPDGTRDEILKYLDKIAPLAQPYASKGAKKAAAE